MAEEKLPREAGEPEEINERQADAPEEEMTGTLEERTVAQVDDAPGEELTGTLEERTEAQVDDAPDPVSPDDYMSKWGEWANSLSDKTWLGIQYGAGIVVGTATMACLYLIHSEGFLPLNVILAFLVARFAPKYLEMLLERKMPKASRALLITLLVLLAVYSVYLFVFHGPALDTL